MYACVVKSQFLCLVAIESCLKFNNYMSLVKRNMKRDQKITVIFQLSELHMFEFVIFFRLCWYTCQQIYICLQYQPFWIVSLFLTDKTVSRVLVCSSIFYYYYSKK